jgi:hypothetical protein
MRAYNFVLTFRIEKEYAFQPAICISVGLEAVVFSIKHCGRMLWKEDSVGVYIYIYI